MTLDTAAGPVRCFFGGAPRGAGAPVVLLVHGSGGDATVWDAMLPFFRSVTAVALDLPGRGASSAPRLPSAAAYAAFLDQVRQALEVPSLFVVGQSLGGGIAQHYAVDFEAHCDGIVAANSACDFSISGQRLRAIDDDWEACVQTYALGQVSPRASHELLQASVRMIRARDRAAFKDDLRACNGFDSKPWLHRLKKPLLVLLGQDDPLVVPARSLAIYERVPHAQLVALAPCGHCTMLEQPRRFAAVIEEFVSSTEPLVNSRNAKDAKPR
ncbi:MAG TPA: alpha/beta hydrolase [Ramlibacter sp.]|nr:alpha/beta hydrolase [Ramlibacter sp.]